jgi:hypothetical protein
MASLFCGMSDYEAFLGDADAIANIAFEINGYREMWDE